MFVHTSQLQRLYLLKPTSSNSVAGYSGLMTRPHRAHISDTLLETLVYLKCNMNVV